jgi:hypothetical protein
MLLYTDGSKLDEGRTGSGWAIHCVGNGTARKIQTGHCHLGSRAEVYDPELHATQEALGILRELDIPAATTYLCVDNQSALDTLHSNASSTQYSGTAGVAAAELCHRGWKILGVWTPAHVGIVGKGEADSEAKAGATSTPSTACQHARTTKTWMLVQTCPQLRERWSAGLPGAIPSFNFPDHLRSQRWRDTRALWRLHAGRTPSDRDPGADHDKDPEPCDCGESFISSAHILTECVVHRPRTRMLQQAPEVTVSSVSSPSHAPAVLEFLRTTGLGYTRALHAEKNRGGEESRRGEESGSDEGGGGSGDGGDDDGSGRDGEGGEEAAAVEVDEEGDGSGGEWRFGLFK